MVAVALGVLWGLPADRATARILGPTYFKTVFAEIVTANAPWDDSSLEVENFTANPSQLAVDAGAISYRLLNQVHSAYLGSKLVRIQLLVDGRQADVVTMSGDLVRYGPVVSLRQPQARNTILCAKDLQVQRRSLNALRAGYLSNVDEAVGKQLTVSLRAGAVLYQHQLTAPPLVQRGDRVTIVAATPSFRITVPGQVRDQGALGELVPVKNMMSRKVVLARVAGPDIVEVDF